MRENVFVFSGFKNYHQLKEMSMLLTDNNGNIRSFDDFYKDVKLVNETYNKHYLQAEYDHAISTGIMAAKWEKFKAEADLFPMLRYRALHDGRTRREHLDLDGATYPIGDDFWKTYYPPNGWRCRCDVDQVEKQAIKEPKSFPVLQPMFRNNVGVEGVVFSNTHPYFDISEKKEKTDEKKIKDRIENIAKLSMPLSDQYDILISYSNNGKISKHILIDKNNKLYNKDYKLNKIISEHYAQGGSNVEILPNLSGYDEILVDSVLPNKKKGKYPDLRIDNIYIEVESINVIRYSKHTISNAIGHGAEQANNIVVDIPIKISKSKMFRLAKGRFKTHTKLNEITFKYKNTYTTWSRKGMRLP